MTSLSLKVGGIYINGNDDRVVIIREMTEQGTQLHPEDRYYWKLGFRFADKNNRPYRPDGFARVHINEPISLLPRPHPLHLVREMPDGYVKPKLPPVVVEVGQSYTNFANEVIEGIKPLDQEFHRGIAYDSLIKDGFCFEDDKGRIYRKDGVCFFEHTNTFPLTSLRKLYNPEEHILHER